MVLTRLLAGTGEIGANVRNKDPKDVPEALEKASKIEVRLELDKQRVSVYQVESKPMPEFQTMMANMNEQLDALVTQVAAMAVSAPRGRVRGFTGLCCSCGGKGHFARDCPSKNDSGGGRGFRSGRSWRGRS